MQPDIVTEQINLAQSIEQLAVQSCRIQIKADIAGDLVVERNLELAKRVVGVTGAGKRGVVSLILAASRLYCFRVCP